MRARLAPVRGLILGDLIVLLLLTVYGFLSHETLTSAGWRIPAFFFPLALGWFLAAPWLGLYDPERVRDPRQLWRVVWAWLLAAPFGLVLRAILLQRVLIPIFALVAGGIGLGFFLVWRLLYALYRRRRS